MALRAAQDRRSDYQRAAAGLGRGPRIAVIYAVGVIASGRNAFDPLNGAIVGSDSLVEQIREVRDDSSVKAIILRVDSPGGSSVASDVIWRELMITRDKNPDRPLIASMSDLAASGGYYISLPAQVIVAQPATLTGRLCVQRKIGRRDAEQARRDDRTVTAGANADIYSPFAPFSPTQRAAPGSHAGVYENFVEKTAESRKTTPEKIDQVAQGRVWTGRQAREHGLVDALGGLDVAVRIAKERANIPADQNVELVTYPERRTLFQAISDQFGGGQMNVWGALAGGVEQRAVAALTLRHGCSARRPLALMPYASSAIVRIVRVSIVRVVGIVRSSMSNGESQTAASFFGLAYACAWLVFVPLVVCAFAARTVGRPRRRRGGGRYAPDHSAAIAVTVFR